MKTLAAIKMEKNFIGVRTKGYSERPYEVCDSAFLLDRIREETDELALELSRNWNNPFYSKDKREQVIDAIKGEIADVSNLLDYLFELVST